MTRSSIKAGVARALYRTGLHRLFSSINGTGHLPVVIGYHRVVEDFAASARTSIPSLLVSPAMLERQLDWIGRRFTFIGLDELGARVESDRHSNRRLAAVTFDDGYADFYDHAFPLLKKKGIPAAIFVMTGLLSTEQIADHDRLYLLLSRRIGRRALPSWKGITAPSIDRLSAYRATRLLIEALPSVALRKVIESLEAEDEISKRVLQSFRLLSWEQLRRIRQAGFVVGSHTRSHIILTNESPASVREELKTSRAELETQLAAPIQHFVYPSGLFNTTSVQQVAEAGYRFAYTGCTHRSAVYPHLTLPRTLLWEKSSLDSHNAFSGPVLSCHIHRVFDVAGGCRQRHEVTS
jgi:peptidoglycan/xylan/chitin deacetylase (PgdA/CDA1 family)